MKFKNINPVERYLDKAIVLVAAGAAAYFIYSTNFQEPNLVYLDASRTGEGIKPGDVEVRIHEAVAALEQKIAAQKPFHVAPYDYVADYEKKRTEPLPPSLLAGVATLGPANLKVAVSADREGPVTFPPIVVPTVPPLTEPLVEGGRAVVVLPGAGTPAAAAHDLTYVHGKATLPLAALRDNVGKASMINNVVVPQLQQIQHTAIYRIHVQRQEKHANGAWSAWVDVPPLPINPPLPVLDPQQVKDKDLPERIDAIRAQVGAILTPGFYQISTARPDLDVPLPVTPAPAVHKTVPPPARPVVPPRVVRVPVPASRAPAPAPMPEGATPEQIRAAHRGALRDTFAGNAGASPFMPGSNSPMNPFGAPGTPANPGMAAAPPAAMPLDAGTMFGLAAEDSVAVSFWDTQVQPEFTYRYRVRLEIINPLYHQPKQLKAEPADAVNVLFLNSAWTEFKDVTIEADEYFYLMPNSVEAHSDSTASFKIFKWHQGMWVAAEDRVEMGATLGGAKKVLLKIGAPQLTVDFGAVYTVVDIHKTSGAAGDDVQAVLLNNTTGELVLRDLLLDGRDKQRLKLEATIKDLLTRKAVGPSAAAGAAGGGRVE